MLMMMMALSSECKINKQEFDPNMFFNFVQITDVHIEDFTSLVNRPTFLKEAQERYNDYITLTQNIIPNYVKPHVITITGDLTHAIALNFANRSLDWMDRRINIYVPGQCEEQWEFYSNITNVANEKLVNSMKNLLSSIKIVYPFEEDISDQRIFDLPGNHDSFGVSDKKDENKWLFLKYSKSAKFFKNGQFYVFDLTNNFGTFRYIMFDSTPIIGSYRPVNFFSSIQISQLRKLENFLSSNSVGISQVFALGHYPSSMISIIEDDGSVSTTYTIQDFYKRFNITSYFSGHLHKEFFEMSKYMPKSGHVEIQSPDFKKERSFKIITVDNNRIGFKDFTVRELEKKPGIIISHPKDCRFITDREPRVFNDDFIRLFIVYPYNIESEKLKVIVKLDGNVLDDSFIITKDQAEYRIKFNFSTLNDSSTHKITVEFDGSSIVEHYFTKNDSICEPDLSRSDTIRSFISWCVLSLDWRTIFREVTHYSCIASVLILFSFKFTGFLRRVTFIEVLSLVLQAISMRYGLWFLGVLTEDNRFGGLLNLTYFYFNPINSLEPVHKLEPFTSLSDSFNTVTIIDDSSLFFTLVGPTFVFSHLAIIIGYLLLECLDRIESRYHRKYFKLRILLFLIIFISHLAGFLNFYRKYVRSYGKFVMFTSFNNLVFPFLNIAILATRTYKDCTKHKVE